jgi:hypothetical protein
MYGRLLSVGQCECRDYTDAQSDSGFPMCNGTLRLYPSGAIACDCGDHVTAPVQEE